MNDQQILEFIAVKHPVRAVQLADKFDKSEREASEALRALVDIGDVVRKSGTGPNGQPAQFYTLSESFLKSRPGQLLIARLEAANTPAPSPAPAAPAPPAPLAVADHAPAASALPTPAPVAPNKPSAPAESPATSTGANRAELGVAHILKHGSVSDADLRQAIGLRAGQYPSAWLGAAIKRGDVNKDGREWKPGRGVEIRTQPAFGGALGLAGATPRATGGIVPNDAWDGRKLAGEVRPHLPADAPADPVVVKELVAHLKQINSELTAPPKFRCGLWSDGVLELQRNGVTVAELEQGEGETVAAFMARLRQPLETT
jgi:hypothetical protein